jgi:class 3 adenylate cyclase
MASALPTGTVTFLFTDIEGSTRLLQYLGGSYAQVLHDHQQLLRQAFAQHGGGEVDTQGDSFFVAFATAPSAVAAGTFVAVDQHRARQSPFRQHRGPRGGAVGALCRVATAAGDDPLDHPFSLVAAADP